MVIRFSLFAVCVSLVISLAVMVDFLSGPHNNRHEEDCLNMNYSYFYDIYIKSFLFSFQGLKRKGAILFLVIPSQESGRKLKCWCTKECMFRIMFVKKEALEFALE